MARRDSLVRGANRDNGIDHSLPWQRYAATGTGAVWIDKRDSAAVNLHRPTGNRQTQTDPATDIVEDVIYMIDGEIVRQFGSGMM